MGCASTGPPRPPSLHLPQAVRDLTARRMGDHVDLTFTVPTLSTDRQPLAGRHGAGNLTAVLCRHDQPAVPCRTIQTQPVTPGEAAHAQDRLPTALLAGPPLPLRYSVRILNAQGHVSADSRDAVAAAGAAPTAVESLAATTTTRGVQLTWRATQSEPDATILVEAASGATRRTLTVAGDPGGAIDTAPHVGDVVTYTVLRSIKLPGTPPATLNSAPTSVTLTRSPDTFAPAAPLGLAAVSAQMEGTAPEIDLSWEPNSEPDLAGYLVERTDTGTTVAAPILLTPVPTNVVSYRDLAVQPGHTYRYTVRAQDTAGNRSKPGAPATESLRP